jgi:hypothetical protein
MKSILIILFLFFYLAHSAVSAQKHQDLFTYYKNRQIEKLESRIQQLKNADQTDPEILFFSTVLSENGQSAFTVYDRLYKQSKGPLKNLAAEKLAEYYFARGFYVKSSEYKNIAKTYIPVKTIEESKVGDNKKVRKTDQKDTSIYKIQVGAFGVRENAKDLASFLRGKKMVVSVVTREVDGKDLYCVWVTGGSSLESTEDMAEEIKKKYRLSYRILKP